MGKLIGFQIIAISNFNKNMAHIEKLGGQQGNWGIKWCKQKQKLTQKDQKLKWDASLNANPLPQA